MEKKSAQILAALKQLNGTAIASIDTVTPVKLTGGKKNPMQGKITKKVTGSNIMFFCNLNSNGYENMVNRRLAEEGKDSFQLSPRAWGERVPSTPFVTHKGKVYIETIFLRPPTKIEYFCDGVTIEPEDIPGLPVKKSESTQGNLDRKVIIRTYDINNIKSLRMGELSVL